MTVISLIIAAALAWLLWVLAGIIIVGLVALFILRRFK